MGRPQQWVLIILPKHKGNSIATNTIWNSNRSSVQNGFLYNNKFKYSKFDLFTIWPRWSRVFPFQCRWKSFVKMPISIYSGYSQQMNILASAKGVESF